MAVPSLFETTTLGPMTLKNRLWRSATWEKMADDTGHMTPELQAVYEDLARGGVGTIITGYAFIREEEQPNAGMMGIYDDSFIAEYKTFTDRIHELGANIVLQGCYGGSQTDFKPEGRLIWGPSAVEHPVFKVTPEPMSHEDIMALIDSYAQAARRAKAAGFDGFQIHGAHGYLLSQFLTPYFNRRTDEYGGPIENRARIIYEVLDAIRKEVGPEYPVLIKIHSTDEWGAQGLTPEESVLVAKELEARGITALELSGGHLSKDPSTLPIKPKIINENNQSYFREPAAMIAEAVEVPVILVGGNRSVAVLENILGSTPIKYFSFSRTLLSEPDLPNKWQQGSNDRPRCVSCNRCWGKDKNMCILDRKNEE
ncbi:NADH:flavin oxidoreductase [Desulfosediminicola ganghwensis]|uniref:NADH:flavin oxidoreductase n=1 Tax=Desulfosediminicola ganghwensis TaxID=2569540 RepID=UPI0010ABEEBF|nr:NADH:flavin oxidoreductase [Desulfosediminicola ganghwensis]